MKYSFTCPLEGCSETMSVEGTSDDEATDKLVEKAKEHLVIKHPDIHKTDIEIKNDIQEQMIKVDMNTQ